MLVLTRKIGDRIVLPSLEITISVQSVRGGRVVLGIEARRHISILRSELRAEPPLGDEKKAIPDPNLAEADGAEVRSVLLATRPSLARREYGNALTGQGFVVRTADDGVQCLERLRESLPGVLVIEPELPWGGGDGVLDVVQDELAAHGVPVFVLAEERNRSAIYHISRFAISDFALQPLRIQQLVERVRRLATRRETLSA